MKMQIRWLEPLSWNWAIPTYGLHYRESIIIHIIGIHSYAQNVHTECRCTGPSDVKPTDSLGPLSFFPLWPLLHHAFDNCFFNNLYLRAWGTRLVLTPIWKLHIYSPVIYSCMADHMIIVREKVQQIKLARTIKMYRKKISKVKSSWCRDDSMNALADKVHKQGVPQVICTCTP